MSAARAAESANRAKDEFLAMLGHELRNPLSPILTALQLMKLQGHEGSERARTVIERQVNHLTRLVDDLLDVSRIARGKVELKTEVVEMAEVVAKAIEMASPLLEQRTHTLTVDVPRRGLRVDGDPTRLSQVVSNLLTNAAKYTPPGGAHHRSRASTSRTRWCCRVRDTGIGIAPEVLPRVFDLFVQERQAIDRSQGGLGIGLTIVRNLIERHGGSVLGAQRRARARAASSSSACPWRTRPASSPIRTRRRRAIAERRPAATARRASSSSTTTRTAAEMLAEALTRQGLRHARGARRADRAARGRRVPAGRRLPRHRPAGHGRLRAGRAPAQIPGLADLRLIAVTGYGQESDRRRTREAGFHHHLVKPVDVDAIEAAATARS